MKKSLAIACLLSAALFACGGKNKKTDTMPDNKTGTTGAPMKGSTGGAMYGGNKYGGGTNSPDPCAGGI